MDRPSLARPHRDGEGIVLVLASASPRRAALLKQSGIQNFRVVAPEVDETPAKGELPRAYALRMAAAKVRAVTVTLFNPPGEGGNLLVLAADTVVALGRRILPKAEDESEVKRCLGLLSGRRHQVLTALALAMPGRTVRMRIVTTRVAFKRLSPREIEDYTASGEGVGKAGGYAIQGRAEALIRFINGSYSNVVGLPLCETLAVLEAAGYGSSQRQGWRPTTLDNDNCR